MMALSIREKQMETYNIHIKGICENISRYYEEVARFASAGVTALSTADKNRLASYLTEARSYIDWVYALQADDDGGFLDLPESHPKLRTVEVTDLTGEVENNQLRDVLEYLLTLQEELMNSQSSRLGAGLIGHDFDRAIAILDVLDSYIVNFVENNSPMDMPESSPRKAMVSPGKKGVKKS